MFSLVRSLPSSDSSAFASFAAFSGTMGRSDFSAAFTSGLPTLPFPDRSVLQTPRRSPGSRSESFTTCMGSLTTPVPDTARDLSLCLVLPSPSDYKVGVRYGFFEARCPSPLLPLSTLQYKSRDSHCKTRGQSGSLRLLRRALSSPTLCRSPGAQSNDLEIEQFLHLKPEIAKFKANNPRGRPV